MTGIVKLIAVGDIMLGDNPVCYGHGVKSVIEKKGLNFIFSKVKFHFSNGDIIFGNLETVLSDLGNDHNKISKGEMRGRPSYVEELAKNGFNVISIANNHAMQHGPEAFKDTVNTLNNYNVACIGLRNDGIINAFLKKINGVDIAMLGFSMRPEKYTPKTILYALSSEKEIISEITKYKAIVDVVIVSLHWGEEFINYPSQSQIDIGRKIIDAGASLILGHHPHVVQGIEHYKNGYICYSLGNFIFDQWQEKTKESIIIDCIISKNGIEQLKFTPVYINASYQAVICTGEMEQAISKKYDNYTKQVNRYNNYSNYNKMAKWAYLKYRVSSYTYFIRNIHKYRLYIIMQSFLRFLMRRIRIKRC